MKRTENSIFTEEIAKIAENTGKMAENLEVITIQNEIERLDREMGVAQFSAVKRSAPGPAARAAGVLSGVFFTAVCILMSTGFSKANAGLFIIVPLGMAFFGVVITLSNLRAGINEETSRATYRTRREALTRQLEVLQQK
ncbi:hypothetical protein [Prosthecobacter vanneervenii]|uniref:Uncharacterized protein n=1 Tax=Prosthecobacter vanneervenii TaxID=48466 RepID=A0A7W7YA95_9BACT|nr:hypothetical protein [Prosthecobacter vanneervenii]MBB5032474.1 hypothetical protein [Prosthecobacter vanneervenii]